MVNIKYALPVQTFRNIFVVLMILGLPICGEGYSFFQAVGQSGSRVIGQSGNQTVGQSGSPIGQSGNQAVGQSGSPVARQSVGLINTALGAEQGHGEAHGVPKIVFYQVLNFLLFAGLLFYLLKDKVRSFYQNRFDLFQEQFKAAYKEREEMEASYKDYQQKLKQINLTSEDQIAKAKQEASATKARMLDEAGLESERLQKEAQILLDLEHKREKRIIQAGFVEKVIEKIQSEISESLTDQDKKALIHKFEGSLK